MLKPINSKKGFTLIELLTVIAILAILGAIIFPTVGQFRTLAKKTSDANDLRRIVQASQMFAAQNGEKFVTETQTVVAAGITDTGGANITDVAAVLAIGGDLNDPQIWVSENEEKPAVGGAIVTFTDTDADGTPDTYAKNTGMSASSFSFDYVTNLATWMESTIPVAFSRMAAPGASQWGASDVYQTTGGHVAFLGGSVSWYEDLTGKLIAADGTSADNISAAIPAAATIRASAQ
ncbi:Prokaryotic N-terminal methylation motif domain protein [Verrucomicrobiia bacterium DG1235]|nr:Prokaryotic N-terminal methylation motif domain protein [Verrucomicrobiae bacterium DG1235]